MVFNLAWIGHNSFGVIKRTEWRKAVLSGDCHKISIVVSSHVALWGEAVVSSEESSCHPWAFYIFPCVDKSCVIWNDKNVSLYKKVFFPLIISSMDLLSFLNHVRAPPSCQPKPPFESIRPILNVVFTNLIRKRRKKVFVAVCFKLVLTKWSFFVSKRCATVISIATTRSQF